jgi:predicted RNA binding protein YcfA (HicA-like mRNA interferase family)
MIPEVRAGDVTERRLQLRSRGRGVTFAELVRLLEANGFKLFRQKGSVRYYMKPGVDRLIRVDYHGSKEVPTGTCQAVLKSAYIRMGGRR